MRPIVAPVRTGLLAPPGETGPRGVPAPTPSGKQHIVLNFDKADIAEVSSQIFSDQLKVSYVLDQTLQGRISMYIEGDFDNKELLQMIMRAYEANGISIIPRKGFYFIKLSREAAAASIPVANEHMLGQKGGGPLIVIYRLRYIDAKQASDLIGPFVTPGERVTVDPVTNSVIFVDQASGARTLISLLKTIDINVLKEVSMAVLPLHSISPQDAVQGMKTLMGQLGKFKQSAIGSSLALLPLENFGGVLIMARSPELLATAEQWIKAMDAQGLGNQEQIYVYFVQNGMATDIAQILSEVLGIGGGQAGKGQKIVPSGSAAKSAFGGGAFGGGSSGSSPFGGTGASGAFGSAGSTTGAAGGAGTPGGAAGQQIGAAMKGKPPGFTGEVSIISDEVNNAIVIRANPVDYAKLMKTVKKLDIIPRAVLIEVMIAEVELTKQFQFGLEYYFQTHPATNTGFGVSFGGLSNQAASSSTTTTTTAGAFPINLGAIASSGVALDWVANAQNLAVLLSALSSKTNVSVLSTPTLLATDNQEATLTVGGEQPVPTGSVTGYTTGSSVISTIDYAETGVILDITPHINVGGLVRLDLDSTVRRVNQQTVTVGNGNTAPTFTERHIKTSILAQNGRTVVIGGIIDSQGSQGKSGIPWLENIPILSPLFAGHTSSLDRVELLIAITPHVVEKAGTQAPAELLDKLRNLRMRVGY
ncbi:MAG: type II secretion system secretin GspD [Syntrophobacteraceae bacterium]|nr:type II secretion system secretin GspD [Syntrophobacteraceae bacterium]